MLARIGTLLLLFLALTNATSHAKPAQSDLNQEVLEIEKQIETVLSKDSEKTSKLESRLTLASVTQQFMVLGLSQSMVERHRLQEIYGVLQASSRVEKGIEFEIFAGAQHGFAAFRVADHIFISTDLFSLPGPVLEGILAHELSHSERDYKRKLLIDMNDLEPRIKQALKARMEARADEGAVRVLSEANRDAGATELYLDIFIKAGKLGDGEAQVRLAAARGAINAAGSF